MVRQTQQMIEDVGFIFSECARLRDLLIQGIDRISRDDASFSIPHPVSGDMLCGRAAAQRVEVLAEEMGRRGGLLGRVEFSTLKRTVANLIVERFVREKRPLDIKQMDRMLNTASKRARAACVDITHFVPCHLTLTKDPEELRIGPVIFRNRRQFRNLLAEKVRAYRRNGYDGQEYWGRRLLLDALRYYRNFNWVAEVEVKGCDAVNSDIIAEQAVLSALDCVHLILGANWTDRMRVRGPAGQRDPRAKLTLSSEDQLDVSTSFGIAGQINFSDGWSQQLTDPDVAHVLGLCGVALEAAVNPDIERPLSRRFLDAAQWFGEAARDESPSTRVVKYATALERMVMTEEHEDINRHLSQRVAALCLEVPDVATFEAWRAKAQTLYGIRSKLVHGSMSPRSPDVEQGVHLGAELGRATILSAISKFGADGLRLDAFSSNRLGQWFEEIITRVNAMICKA